MYIFDTNSFRELFRFYPRRFPQLWKRFDELVSQGEIFSVKEVLKEMQASSTDHLDTQWAIQNKVLFREPSVAEALFLREIYGIDHFQ